MLAHGEAVEQESLQASRLGSFPGEVSRYTSPDRLSHTVSCPTLTHGTVEEEVLPRMRAGCSLVVHIRSLVCVRFNVYIGIYNSIVPNIES